jgi:polyhydroxybutyrate depolymerase
MMTTLTLVCAMLAGKDSLSPGDFTRTVLAEGRSRTYLVHVPKSYDGRKPFPLVMAFHGGATDAALMARFCGLDEKADQAGFVVVYPNGTGEMQRLLTWNAGSCCGYAKRNNVDDVAFVRALLDDLHRVARIDPKRIYATGMSNGAMMCYRLAAELSDRIAAIAPVAGTMCIARAAPKRPVPVIHFHGTRDEFVPIAGGRGSRSISQTDYTPIDESIVAWVTANGCRSEPVVTELADKAGDGMSVVRRDYAGGRDGSEVVLFLVNGGGHTWPGRDSRMAMLGKSTKNISANDLMWEFFEKHPMK